MIFIQFYLFISKLEPFFVVSFVLTPSLQKLISILLIRKANVKKIKQIVFFVNYKSKNINR